MQKPKDYTSLPRKEKTNDSKDQRLVRLLKFIFEFNNRKSIDANVFAKEIGMSKRTVLRDIAALQRAGFPIDKENSQSPVYHLDESENTLGKLEQFNNNQHLVAQHIIQLEALGIETPANMSLFMKEQVSQLEDQEREEALTAKALPRSKFLSLFSTDPRCSSASFQSTVLNDLMMHHLSCKNYKKALSIAEFLLKIARNARLLLTVALCYKGLKQYPKALEYCRKSLDDDPSFVWALLQMASIYQLEGQMSIALSCIDKAIAKNPNNWLLIQRKVNLLLQLNQPEKALEYLEKQPKQPYGQFFHLKDLARLYERVGKWKEALACIEALEKYTTQDKPLYAHYKQFVQRKKQFLHQKLNSITKR